MMEGPLPFLAAAKNNRMGQHWAVSREGLTLVC